MNKSSSIEAIDKTILSEQAKFRLSEIIGIKNYFCQEINQRKSCSKKLTVCSCHVTYAFQCESTLYSCLNFKELLPRSRREI